MTLMFGNLTLAFVRFGTAVQGAFATGASPAAIQEFNDASDDFKRSAANDALYLVCIGKFHLLSLPWRTHHLAFATVVIWISCVPNEPLLPPTPTLFHPLPFTPVPRVSRRDCINLVAQWPCADSPF